MKEIDFIGVPMNLGCRKNGVEQGTQLLREICFGQKHSKHIWHDTGDITCPSFDTVSPGEDANLPYIEQILAAAEELANRVEQSLFSGRFPFIAGGDHSLSWGSIAGFLRFAEHPHLIYIDAHADMNPSEDSPSHNIHGMHLAYLMGLGMMSKSSPILNGRVLDPKNAYFIGTRSLDPAERDFFKTLPLHKTGLFPAIADLAGQTHLSFDIDVFDPAVAPGTGVPEKNGLSLEEGLSALRQSFAKASILSMDLVEINPLLDKEGLTAEAARKIISIVDELAD